MTHYSSTGGGCPQLGGFEAAVLLLVFDSVEALDPVEVGLGLSSGGRLLWTRSQNVITSDRQDRWRAFSIESKLRFCSWVFFLSQELMGFCEIWIDPGCSTCCER